MIDRGGAGEGSEKKGRGSARRGPMAAQRRGDARRAGIRRRQGAAEREEGTGVGTARANGCSTTWRRPEGGDPAGEGG